MDNISKNISILESILHYCEDITQMVERFGNSVEILKNDFAYRHACSMCLIHIGELSSCLTDDFMRVYADIPWKSIKDMRMIAHDYESVSVEKIWNAIKLHVPPLSFHCSVILAQYNTPEQLALEADYDQEGENELEP